MKRKIITIFILCFLTTGCFLDPYTNPKYGKQAIEAWFSYKDGDNDLGKTRRSVENIGTINDQECKFIEKYKSNYIFKCTVTYKEQGETIIPFSKAKTLDLYTVFIPNKTEFTYKVYNSSSVNGIWKTDEDLQ